MPYRPKDKFRPNVESNTPDNQREYHNVQTASYWLPNDDIEQDRLNEMHFAIKDLFEGELLPKTKEILDFNSKLKVLDLGCATGAWVLEMSVEYPNCDYYGIDISPNFPVLSPNNTHFLLHNVLDGIPFQNDYFDYVRLGNWSSNLKAIEWPSFLKDVYRVTKPGGLIQNLELNILEHNQDCTGVMTALYNVNKMNKMHPDLVPVLPDLLKEAGFTTILTDKRSVNFGDDDQKSLRFMCLARNIIKRLGFLIAPALGMSTEEYIASTPHLIQKAKDMHSEWTYVAFLSQKPKQKSN
ncbi:S-adenosyl-L-methionine-dependent methyltransferase [Phycomyces nitens]|nr:S-adenosyl-L-methionine-dependent methyltransferase [Phycomyces nitens]